MQHIDTQIAIIGGGLAGTYLAWRLEQQGIDYQLLEAKPTLGGRILGRAVSAVNGSHYLDLGPTWIFPHQQTIQRIVADLGLSLYEQYHQGDALFQTAHTQAPRRTAGAGGMLMYRLSGGMKQVIDRLGADISAARVRLEHKVQILERLNNQWRLQINSTEGKIRITAQQVVVAVPPRVFVQGIEGTQALFPELHKHFQSTPTWMAAQAKFVAVFDTPFWRHQGLSGEAYSQRGPMVEIHDASAADNSVHALFGFIGIPAAMRQQVNQDQLQRACREQLVGLFGDEAGHPLTCELKDWAQDDDICTPQDIADRPQHPYVDLSPFTDALDEHRLYFASSEVAQSDPGYLEGAIDAANSVLARLREQTLTGKRNSYLPKDRL